MATSGTRPAGGPNGPAGPARVRRFLRPCSGAPGSAAQARVIDTHPSHQLASESPIRHLSHQSASESSTQVRVITPIRVIKAHSSCGSSEDRHHIRVMVTSSLFSLLSSLFTLLSSRFLMQERRNETQEITNHLYVGASPRPPPRPSPLLAASSGPARASVMDSDHTLT